VEELKGTKISSSSFLINDHMHAAIAPSHAHHGRGERRERERNRDFNALLIHFSSCFQTSG
jgi:hypothetical protein